MNPEYAERTGLDRFAKFDLSESRHRIRDQRRKVDWFGVWIYLLKQGDDEAAELVRARNKEA